MFPQDLDSYLRYGLALVFVLALVGLLSMILRRFMGSGPSVRRGRQRRLALVEVLPVDAKRRLLLVRRDGVEHLLLLGTERDIVIETGIGATAFQEAVATLPPAASATDVRQEPQL
ncbi:flagellar biosynthetic protein FliO [Arenibaculum pallidiluteum]|uniref:flagellar biosynthetic protein FliO n=1 Tax=Arenibaculum pallidiluteum TaxID=2812559 RepID=UPI001A96A3B6|nr:flagellar biosynthetic protein FliO [Arenibaculum pallidiluteum]